MDSLMPYSLAISELFSRASDECLGKKLIRVLSPLLFVAYKTCSLGSHGKVSFNFAAKIFHIYITSLSTFETRLGLETGKGKNVKL